MRRSARKDLRRGRSAMIVPTATATPSCSLTPVNSTETLACRSIALHFSSNQHLADYPSRCPAQNFDTLSPLVVRWWERTMIRRIAGFAATRRSTPELPKSR
jgi:hypothetical protein